jgi:DNA-binding transcriptional ArsR family regulator
MTGDEGAPAPVGERFDGERSAPEFVDAFSLLADDTRLRVIVTLYEHGCIGPDSPALTFSELRRLVGVGDTGRFNYHLRRLRESFVSRTEEGYVLTEAGEAAGTIVVDRDLVD